MESTNLEILRDPQARRMRDDRDFGDTVEGEMPGRRGTKTVSRRPDPGYSLGLKRRDSVLNCGDPAVGAVAGHPSFAIEVCTPNCVCRTRVALKEVWDDCAVAIAGEAVGEQLSQEGVVSFIVWNLIARLTLLLINGIPKTSVRKRTTLSLG